MIQLGAFTVRRLDGSVRVAAETASSVASIGRGTLFEVAGLDDSMLLTVRDTRWSNGERDIVACSRNESPERYDTLVARMRLVVLESRGLYADLRQARVRPNRHANLFVTDIEELNRGSGVDVSATLANHGASEVGTREALLDDPGPARGRICVRFPEDAILVPLIAYVLTRIAPVASGQPA
jgi:hypothetical protein